MPSEISIDSRNAHSRYSELIIGNLEGRILQVSAVNTTTITFTDASLLTGKSLYAVATPGQAVIVRGVAASDAGKVANITIFSGNVATVSVDLSTALAAGDLVWVMPPLSAYVTTNGGHSLQATRQHDDTLGLGETVLTHNTPLTVDPRGTIPFFLGRDSQALGRLLLAGVGAYKKTGTGSTAIHGYVPPQVNDGTYAEAYDFSAYSQDGNGVLEQMWIGLFGTRTMLNFPQRGVANGSMDVVGTHVLREVGGSGKVFTTGANNWKRTSIERDAGNRHTFAGLFAEFGGSFNGALSETAYDKFVLEANVEITREIADDTPIGSQDRMVPVEHSFGIQVTGRRIAENDTVYQDFFGSSTAATPGEQTETRLLLKAVHPGDTTKTLTVDIPYGTWRVDDIQRQHGRQVESFTFKGKQKITSGVLDTANPLYRIQLVNGEDIDYLAALG